MERLKPGDVIGFVSPSGIPDVARNERDCTVLQSLGFQVKIGANVYKNTYGYSATEQERAQDINIMVADSQIKLILFSGGEGAGEVLPYIDYESISHNPKFFCSYSDGTTILNAIYAKTGQIVHYGQSPGVFYDLRYYDYLHFAAHFIAGHAAMYHKNSEWQTLYPGICKGVLIGGYTRNFALLLNTQYFAYDNNTQYILFLEDHERYSSVAEVSGYLSYIEQSPFMRNVAGLLFGHYSGEPNQYLLQRLQRFGQAHNIPVAYCDDFGHGANHAILPIGAMAQMDSALQTLTFL